MTYILCDSGIDVYHVTIIGRVFFSQSDSGCLHGEYKREVEAWVEARCGGRTKWNHDH